MVEETRRSQPEHEIDVELNSALTDSSLWNSPLPAELTLGIGFRRLTLSLSGGQKATLCTQRG